LHEDGEVTLYIRGHLNVDSALELLSIGGRVANLHEVNALSSLGSLFLAEGEDVVFVAILKWYVGKAAGVAFKYLLLTFLKEEELHPGVDCALVVRVEPYEEAPLLARVYTIGHDLAVCELLGSKIGYWVTGCTYQTLGQGRLGS
jgi:hypothetical protein